MRLRKLATRVGASLALAAAAFAAAPFRPDRRMAALDAFAIPAATIVNPGLGRVERVDVVVRDGRVEPAESSAATTSQPLERYRGSFVLPGLIDMHIHYWSEEPELFGLLLLAKGVTTVRDTGDTEGTIFATRTRIEAGELPGPRIFACGSILDGSPPAWPGSVTADDEEAAARAVDEIADAGGDCIKVYRKISPRVLATIHRSSRKRALPVIETVSVSLARVQRLFGLADRRL